MSTQPQHPLDDLHAARRALHEAASSQVRVDITRQQWPAYGPVILDILNSLRNVTGTLTDQLDYSDRQSLYNEALRDQPQQALDRAVQTLHRLNEVLTTACRDVEDYWREAQSVVNDVPND